jgi:hypothetical protein
MPTMAALFVIATLVLALYSGAIGGVAYALMRWTWSDPSPMIWYRIGGVALLLWTGGFVLLVAVHDHARIHACRGSAGALEAYRWGFAFVLRGGEWAFLLALLLQLSAVALWAAYQTVNLAFPASLALGATGSLVWGELFMWVRAWVRVWFFAAQSELQA